jgi:fatty acid desaturase
MEALRATFKMGGTAAVNSAKALFKDREEFRSFHTGEEQSFLVVALLYAIALAALGLVWVASRMPPVAEVPAYVAAFIVIGWAQYSLGNGLHEAVHHNLCNRNSDRLAALLTAYPVGLTIAYRETHLGHHKHLGTERDPEFSIYTSFPQTKGALISRFLWFVSGVPAALQFLQQQQGVASMGGTRGYVDLLCFAGVQLGLASLFWWCYGDPLYYIAFWALPIATVGKLLSTTRLLCEHGSPTHDWVVRTIGGSRWQTWAMGAFDFNYHGEHHLWPSVPFAQLQRLHHLHRSYFESHPEYQPFEGRFEFFSGGYFALLSHWLRILPWRKHTQIQPAS